MDIAEQWQADIDNGVPEQTVVNYARMHLAALRALIRTPEIEAAVGMAMRFIEGKTRGERMDYAEFVAKARAVLEQRGQPEGVGRHYADNVIDIRSNYNGLDLQITRVDNNNPVTMVSHGETIRHHGEHVFLTNHLNSLTEAV